MARIRSGSQDGFTLVEVMVTMLVLLVGIAGAVTLIDGANAVTVKTKQREAATNLQRELIEGARAVPYEQLTPNGLRSALQARPGLGDSTPGGGWTIERRGTQFTVTTGVCTVDDPRDGSGDHDSGTFCAGQATGSDDNATDDFKRVTVDLAWAFRGVAGSSRQSAIVTNPSSNLGPEVVSLERDPDDAMIVTDIASIEFTATTATPAEAVRFLVDGAVAGTEEPSGFSAEFDWAIDSGGDYVIDGTYVITATALSHGGLTGPSRSLTVRLNRRAPDAVTGLAGGWNAFRDGADLEWNQNEESDIVGYRVYRRVGSGAWTKVCDTGPNDTDCFDASHTLPLASAYEYYAVALDEISDGGAHREGTPSETLVVTPTDNAPSPPGTLEGMVVGGGHQLDWTAPPAPSVAYPGDDILFFRVYRDGTALGNRFDRTGLGTDLTFTDTATATHQYWVTSVDTRYSESVPVGPVTLP
jgi:prepilin-type N-terminal cleavage/methylation domain-containing protein